MATSELVRLLPPTRAGLEEELTTLTNTPPSTRDHNTERRILQIQSILNSSELTPIPEQTEVITVGHRVTITTNPDTDLADTFTFTIVSPEDAKYLDPEDMTEEYYSTDRPLVQALLGGRAGEIVEFNNGNALIKQIEVSPIFQEP